MRPLSPANRRTIVVVLVALIVIVGASLVGVFTLGGAKMRTIVAHFPNAPGIYAGNHVDVLGIQVGTVTSVKPGPAYATVTMSVRANVPLPANLYALLEAPQVVSDRYVALSPAYHGGPTFPAGAVIPTSRTAIPVSVDEIIDETNKLAQALGPTGANKNGAVSSTLQQLARILGGEGRNINGTVNGFGETFGALQKDAPAITSLLDNLGQFTTSVSQDSTGYEAFANDLAAVSSELAGDSSDLGAALHNLQTALTQVATFIQNNKDSIGATSVNLNTFASTLATEQQNLAAALQTTPLALTNFVNAIDTSNPSGPAVRTRLDLSPASTPLDQQVCGSFDNGYGSSLLRALLVTVGERPEGGAYPLQQYTPLDLVCAFGSALQALGTPPGAPTGPNLSLSALVGGA